MDRQINALMMRMIDYSRGDAPRIQHFLKVYAYARSIGLAEEHKDGMTKQKYRLLFKSFMKITYINDFFNKKDNKIILPTNETINKIISIINEHTEKQYSYENIEKLKKINEKLSLDINKYIEENNKLEEKLKIIKKNV